MKQLIRNHNLDIFFNEKFPSDYPVEIVEMKGLGHPDTLADSLAEVISIEYSKYTLEHFGAILHHQVDKLMIRGGEWLVDFGIEEFKSPINILINGRFSKQFGNVKIPLLELTESAVIKRLVEIFPSIDPKKHLIFSHFYNDVSSTTRWYRPESLNDLPDRNVVWASDTAVIVSSWPLSIAENLAVKCENFFYTEPFIPKYSFIGQDIKVMVLRKQNMFDITICLPFLSGFTPCREFYEDQQIKIHKELIEFIEFQIPENSSLKLHLNTEDNNIHRNHVYLTPFGSCIGIGEEGVVGRGNNINGVIPIYGFSSMEAPYGKNPTYHTGRINGVIIPKMVKAIHHLTNQRVFASALTLNGSDLIPPYSLNVHLSDQFDKELVNECIMDIYKNFNYKNAILNGELVPKSW